MRPDGRGWPGATGSGSLSVTEYDRRGGGIFGRRGIWTLSSIVELAGGIAGEGRTAFSGIDTWRSTCAAVA